MRSNLAHAISERRRLAGGRILRRSRDLEPVDRDPSARPEPAIRRGAGGGAQLLTAPADNAAAAAGMADTGAPANELADTATSPAPAPTRAIAADGADPAAERVRAAGGPLDEASYACHCGMVFSAAVSTTVSCPHCGAEQEW